MTAPENSGSAQLSNVRQIYGVVHGAIRNNDLLPGRLWRKGSKRRGFPSPEVAAVQVQRVTYRLEDQNPKSQQRRYGLRLGPPIGRLEDRRAYMISRSNRDKFSDHVTERDPMYISFRSIIAPGKKARQHSEKAGAGEGAVGGKFQGTIPSSHCSSDSEVTQPRTI